MLPGRGQQTAEVSGRLPGVMMVRPPQILTGEGTMDMCSFFESPRSGVTPLLTLALLAGGCAVDPAREGTPPGDPMAEESAAEPDEADGDTGEAASAVAAPLWSEDFSYNRGWRIGKHLRDLADVDGDGLFDVVGFNDAGVYVGRSLGDRFDAPVLWTGDFGYQAGWRTNRHLRFLADNNGDGKRDIFGLYDDGVYVGESLGDKFGPMQRRLGAFGYSQGWRTNNHLRRVVDVNRDGFADVVGIREDGLHLALGLRSGEFREPVHVGDHFGRAAGYRLDRHPIDLADFDGDGYLDIGAFHDDGVFVARFDGATFLSPTRWTLHFGRDLGRWQYDRHPRYFADVDGDGKADAVGFHNLGSYVALSTGTEFGLPSLWTPNFGYVTGAWRTNKHIRQLTDLDGDRRADVVGFFDDGVWVARSLGDTFAAPARMIDDFGYDAGRWSAQRHVRLIADVTGTGYRSVVGFGDKGVYVGGFTFAQDD